MYCPSCHTQNQPTDLRCLQCGASLVVETVGGSASYRAAARDVDKRIYGRIGSFIGFFLALFLCNSVLSDLYLSKLEIYVASVVSALVFWAIGVFIASRKI